jgi:stage V sporulation protein G
MTITEVKIRKIFTGEEIKNSRVRAIVSITLDGDFAIHDMKVIQGIERLFVAMPIAIHEKVD